MELAVNTQPAEGKDYREDGSLDVVSVFPTIQGEGPFAGTPAVFVRLAGCNLQCPRCDTQYTEGRERLSVNQVLARILGVGSEGCPQSRLVVLTGGEPLRQNVVPLVQALLSEVYTVQIETNGTLYLPGLNRPFVSFVCSPKTAMINSRTAWYVDAYKYVLQHGHVDSADGLPTSALGMPHPPARPHQDFRGDVFVQPLDEQDAGKNARNLKAAVESCMKFGYRLSIQMHKQAGLE